MLPPPCFWSSVMLKFLLIKTLQSEPDVKHSTTLFEDATCVFVQISYSTLFARSFLRNGFQYRHSVPGGLSEQAPSFPVISVWLPKLFSSLGKLLVCTFSQPLCGSPLENWRAMLTTCFFFLKLSQTAAKAGVYSWDFFQALMALQTELLFFSLCSDLSMNNISQLPSNAFTAFHLLEELWV